MTNSWA